MKKQLTPFAKMMITAAIIAAIVGLYKFGESKGLLKFLKKVAPIEKTAEEKKATVEDSAVDNKNIDEASQDLLDSTEKEVPASSGAKTEAKETAAPIAEDEAATDLANELEKEKSEKKEEKKEEKKSKKDAYDF